MKARELIDITIELASARVVVELPNGQQIAVTGYVLRDDPRGAPLIVLKTGKKLKK